MWVKDGELVIEKNDDEIREIEKERESIVDELYKKEGPTCFRRMNMITAPFNKKIIKLDKEQKMERPIHLSRSVEDSCGDRMTIEDFKSCVDEGLFIDYDGFGTYIMDEKMVELGLIPNQDAAKAAYDANIKNGLMTQLRRIQFGKTVEQAHMRGRALVAYWVYEKGQSENVISKEIKEEKTYFVINDYQKLRTLFGELLKEVQRITSEGDYEAARDLVETYGVQIDQELHKEVLDRYSQLNLAPYGGFINPVYTPVTENGKIIDIKVTNPSDYVKQMLRYGKEYSFQ